MHIGMSTVCLNARPLNLQTLPFVLQPPCFIPAESTRNIKSPGLLTLDMDVTLIISDVLDAGNAK